MLALLLATQALASPPALTFAYRSMVGASVRYEAPVSPKVSLLADTGLSTWLVAGDGGDTGQGSPVIDLRPHAKVGMDWHADERPLYVGPRLVAAFNRNLNGVDNVEGAALLTFGRKVVRGDGRWQTQMGAGIGIHAFWLPEPPADGGPRLAVFPLPHLELRRGPIVRRTP